MKLRKYLLVFIPFLFLSNCTSEEAENLLENGNFDLGITNDWWSFKGEENQYFTELTDEISNSGKYSALISCDSSSKTFSYWGQTFNTNLPAGKRLNLKVNVKLDNVEGKGTGIAIRFDDTEKLDGGAEKFTTTQGRKIIKGSHDWQEYEITSDVLTKDMKSVTVYLLMFAGTTGTVYFDDVSLIELSIN